MKISEIKDDKLRRLAETRRFEQDKDNLFDDLEYAFYWAWTKEGSVFWKDVYHGMITKLPEMKDSIVESVINKYRERSKKGIETYGTTLDRNDLSRLEWLNHLQEELMDAVNYIEKLKQL